MIDCRGVNHRACSAIQNVSNVAFSDKLPHGFDITVMKVVETDHLTNNNTWQYYISWNKRDNHAKVRLHNTLKSILRLPMLSFASFKELHKIN